MSSPFRFLAASVFGGVSLLALSASAHATTVSFSAFFSNDSQMVTPTVVANDDTAGKITVEINLDPNSAEIGLLQAIWFDFSPLLLETQLTVPVAINTFKNNNDTGNLGNGDLLNGCSNCLTSPATGGAFDVGFNFDPSDPNVSSNGGVDVTANPPFDPFVFSFADLGNSISKLTGIGFRFQSVVCADGGSGCETSDKVVSYTLNDITSQTPQVPVPAALPLLASAIGAFGVFGWRRRRQTAA